MVKNEYGKEIDFEAAAALMDDEIIENDIADMEWTEQQYFDIYCYEHEKKFGEKFEFAKENPTS